MKPHYILYGVALAALLACGGGKHKVEKQPKDAALATTVRGMKFCYIHAGSFDHRTVRHTVSADYRLGETEVTNAQYAEFLNAQHVSDTCLLLHPQSPTSLLAYKGRRMIAPDTLGCVWDEAARRWKPYAGRDNHPVVSVTWYGAKAFCLWFGGDLPTEAQWELACQGNECTEQSAWYIASHAYSTHPVATTQEAGSYGLYDMLGNVWEWCDDRFDTVYAHKPLTNYHGPAQGAQRVYRGGSWTVTSTYCTPATRRACTPDYHINDLGFRVCLP